MASVENKPSGGNAPNPNDASASAPPAPSGFHPPYPSMRSGAPEHVDQAPQGSRSHRAYGRQGESSMAAVDMKDGSYSSYSKGARPQDKMLTRDPSFSRQGQAKGGHFEPYYRQNDGRHYEMFQHPAERRGEASSRTDDRRSDNDHHYSYSREGPSPGRGYTQNYPPTTQEQMRPSPQRYAGERMPYTPSQPGSPPFRSMQISGSKRKVQDPGTPGTPEGPRLISNQSSDDSINALLPQKRSRSSNGLHDSVALMKSFTPLSPIHSRTFSRDDAAIDMSRFMDPRGSAEGLRIFQSWSSGNSPQEEHSPLDVRYCYNDWQATGRRNGSSRNWDEKMPTVKERESGQQQSSGSRTPPMKGSRGPSAQQERYAAPPQRQQFSNGPPHHSRSDQFLPPKNQGRPSPPSQYTQPLHPDDRIGPYNDQLSRRVPGYNHEMESGRYWQGESGPYQQYSPQRRGNADDNPKVQGRRPTPPATNAWNHYEEYPPNPPMYDQQMPPRSAQYETWSDNRPYVDQSYGNGHPPVEPQSREYTGRHLQSARIETGSDGGATAMRTATGILLLSLPEDKISLSETLCIVRENIEVFIATEADVKAPAPGRKRPVVVGQVGLRCIHCRVATHQSEKVKRAVCFPSSIKRIYRTVIDMKLDHFKACRFVPIDFKMKLEQLKATNARSTGTTMQYFVQASKRMGMVDGGHGIRFCQETVESSGDVQVPHQVMEAQAQAQKMPGVVQATQEVAAMKPHAEATRRSLTTVPSGVSFSLSMDLSLSGASAGSSGKMNSSTSVAGSQASSMKDDIPTFEGRTSLALSEDKSALSPLRCFLRENVYAFSATAEDIAVRTPTTFSVVVGQVGIGCVHCYHLPAKERSNRAVCFPFSIGRIYQSVADIQRFHMGECKMIPSDVKEQFLDLQRASTKGSKGLATRQYWISSARKLGLADTSNGIRFARDPNVPLEKAVSLDILAQVATDVTTASKPLVLPEDESQIAGFIYVVMKQLQPCRFTEADRNKRRLKDVSCVGVECKHCAGQVDGRKFFWSSVNAVESNFVSVHTHMMECKAIPHDLKEELGHLKTLRKEHTAKLKTGSQKSFFSRVWRRLHTEASKVPSALGPPRTSQSPQSVPPQVAVLCQIRRSPSSPGASFQSHSFSSTSFKEEDQINSPLFKEEEHINSPLLVFKVEEQINSPRTQNLLLEAERVLNPPQTVNKFHMLPLAMPNALGASPANSSQEVDNNEGPQASISAFV